MKNLRRKKIILFASIVVIVPLLLGGYYSESPVRHVEFRKKPILPPPINPYWEKLFAEYEESLVKLLHKTGTPGAAFAVVKDSAILYMTGIGLKSVRKSDSIDQHTVFRLGSVSKPYAAMLTSILVHEGYLQWDDPVVQYLPDFKLKSPDQTPCLTVRHVLSHTTGLPYHTYTTLVEDGLPLENMLERLADVQCSRVGEVYSYQNVAFSLISAIIEEATGKTYEEMLYEKIFKPLQMNNASTSYEAMMANGNIAYPHLIRKRKWREIPISDKYYNVVPAGGVNASITDMAKWMKALLGSRPDVITRQSLGEIYEPFIAASAKNRNYRKIGKIKGAYYGMGWRILHFPSDTLVYHGGYVNGYRSEVAVYTKEHLGICILTNSPGRVADTAIPEFLELYKANQDSIKFWEAKQQMMLARYDGQ